MGGGPVSRIVGLTPYQVLAGVLSSIGTSGICDKIFHPIASACGVSVNPFNNLCKLAGHAGELASFLIKHIGTALDWIFDLIEAPFNVVADVVFGILGFIIPIEWSLKEAHCIDDRAIEIGDQVFKKYNLVSLCEVWRDEHKDPYSAAGRKSLGLSKRTLITLAWAPGNTWAAACWFLVQHFLLRMAGFTYTREPV